MTGRREQSGIADYRPRDFVINNNGCSGKVQYSTWSVHLIGVKFARRNLFSCLHFETISDRLLSRSFLGVVRMWNFSAVQRLHFRRCHSAHACPSPNDSLLVAISLAHCPPPSWHLHPSAVHCLPIASFRAFMLTPACCPPPSWHFPCRALARASFLPIPHTRFSAKFVYACGSMFISILLGRPEYQLSDDCLAA